MNKQKTCLLNDGIPTASFPLLNPLICPVPLHVSLVLADDKVKVQAYFKSNILNSIFFLLLDNIILFHNGQRSESFFNAN